MVVACGLNYTMLDEEQLISVLRIVRIPAYPEGCVPLSPQNPLYNGSYAGDDRMRSHAAMNGTVWAYGHCAPSSPLCAAGPQSAVPRFDETSIPHRVDLGYATPTRLKRDLYAWSDEACFRLMGASTPHGGRRRRPPATPGFRTEGAAD